MAREQRPGQRKKCEQDKTKNKRTKAKRPTQGVRPSSSATHTRTRGCLLPPPNESASQVVPPHKTSHAQHHSKATPTAPPPASVTIKRGCQRARPPARYRPVSSTGKGRVYPLPCPAHGGVCKALQTTARRRRRQIFSSKTAASSSPHRGTGDCQRGRQQRAAAHSQIIWRRRGGQLPFHSADALFPCIGVSVLDPLACVSPRPRIAREWGIVGGLASLWRRNWACAVASRQSRVTRRPLCA